MEIDKNRVFLGDIEFCKRCSINVFPEYGEAIKSNTVKRNVMLIEMADGSYIPVSKIKSAMHMAYATNFAKAGSAYRMYLSPLGEGDYFVNNLHHAYKNAGKVSLEALQSQNRVNSRSDKCQLQH